MQMAYQQVVRMTQCEDTLGFPTLLREMLSYLGYVRYPEYRVFEVPRGEHQHRYRVVVYVPADDYRMLPVHSCETTAGSVEMPVQRAAYYMVTMLRSTYTCFDRSPYRYVPSGIHIPSLTLYGTAEYADPEQENCRLYMTAQFVDCQDRFTQALLFELDSVTEQLWQTRRHLAAYTTPQPCHPSYPQSVQFPPICAPSDAGGYVPDRGLLLSVDPRHRGPLLYGEQGPEAHSLYTPRHRLPVDQHSRGHRQTNWRRDDYQPMGVEWMR
jgi:hypothetical protein